MEDKIKFPVLPLLRQFYRKHLLLRANVEAMEVYYQKRLSAAVKNRKKRLTEVNADEYEFSQVQLYDFEISLLNDFLEYTKSL